MIIGILGCGPSGLIARHAVERARESGADIQVVTYSRKQKSEIWGAQYLHRPIPDTAGSAWDEGQPIQYLMQGEPADYLRKVYGSTWDGTISDDLRDQSHLAWDLRMAYEDLWSRYGAGVTNVEVPTHPAELRGMHAELTESHDLVINTIPRPALCWTKQGPPAEVHQFVATPIYALGETDDEEFPYGNVASNTIVYNGDSATSWYRLSNLFDYRTVEWAGIDREKVPKLPFGDMSLRLATVNKPLRHNCDCFPGVHHLGRMGRWQNKYLAHEVYWDVLELITLKELGAI